MTEISRNKLSIVHGMCACCTILFIIFCCIYFILLHCISLLLFMVK